MLRPRRGRGVAPPSVQVVMPAVGGLSTAVHGRTPPLVLTYNHLNPHLGRLDYKGEDHDAVRALYVRVAGRSSLPEMGVSSQFGSVRHSTMGRTCGQLTKSICKKNTLLKCYPSFLGEQAHRGGRMHFFSSPLAGHEYDVYNLDAIIAVFDMYCKGSGAGYPDYPGHPHSGRVGQKRKKKRKKTRKKKKKREPKREKARKTQRERERDHDAGKGAPVVRDREEL